MDLLPLFSVVSLLLCMLVSEVSGLNAWDRATVVCETVGKKHVVEENSNRIVVLDSQCKSGEVAWRLSQTYVQLQINKPSSFRVCFSSAAFPSLEKYGVYKITDGGMVFAGSPNRDGDVCLTSSGTSLDIVLKALDIFYVLTAKFTISCL
uniref:Uncharacterized protein n=1 Tax=Magallana gigas TaxID=29159 RepID=A0A8W8IWD3_MAGGI|nr:uncharacterized protein LOC105325931 [Crassostrea gigas]